MENGAKPRDCDDANCNYEEVWEQQVKPGPAPENVKDFIAMVLQDEIAVEVKKESKMALLAVLEADEGPVEQVFCARTQSEQLAVLTVVYDMEKHAIADQIPTTMLG